MIKNLMRYTLFLIAIDALVNLIINFIQGNPGGLIITSAIVRTVSIFVLFTIIGLILFNIFKGLDSIVLLVISSLIVYMIFPSIVYLLKSNNKSLLEVYRDLHTQIDLFTLICLPYIIASIVCITIRSKIG